MDKEGLLYICEIQNVSAPGHMPTQQLVPVCEAYYKKRTVGYNRLYAALGANQSISMLVRCFNTQVPDYSQELYVFFPNEADDNQFRVSNIQEIVEEDALDLTLSRLEENYDISIESA